jgi:hypothetical protein
MNNRRARPPERRQRLARLLGLVGSAHPGERDAAGRKAHELVRSFGLTWFDIVTPEPVTERACTQCWPHDERPLWREAVEELLRTGRASKWETKFCRNLFDNWRGKLTEKQSNVLKTIWLARVRESS